ADADHFVFTRDLVGKIIKSSFPESVEVGIPGGSGSHVETSLARLLQDLVACVFYGDDVVFAGLRRLRKDGLKRTVLFSAFLNKLEILPLIISDPRNPQIGKKSKLEDSLPAKQWREGNGRGAEQMPVLGNHRLDLVTARGKQAAVLKGTRG